MTSQKSLVDGGCRDIGKFQIQPFRKSERSTRRTATPYSAIRQGDYKLLEFFNDNHVELYDLQADIGEQQNLAVQMPDFASKLRERLHAWRQEIGAQLPSPNPRSDPTRPEYTPPAKTSEGKWCLRRIVLGAVTRLLLRSATESKAAATDPARRTRRLT